LGASKVFSSKRIEARRESSLRGLYLLALWKRLGSAGIVFSRISRSTSASVTRTDRPSFT